MRLVLEIKRDRFPGLSGPSLTWAGPRRDDRGVMIGPVPPPAQPPSERAAEPERRRGADRREGGRRAEDRPPRRGLGTAQAAIWAVIGAVVVLYLFFLALGTVDPGDAKAASIVVAVLAALWLAHSWRRLWAGGFSQQGDRERRGF